MKLFALVNIWWREGRRQGNTPVWIFTHSEACCCCSIFCNRSKRINFHRRTQPKSIGSRKSQRMKNEIIGKKSANLKSKLKSAPGSTRARIMWKTKLLTLEIRNCQSKWHWRWWRRISRGLGDNVMLASHRWWSHADGNVERIFFLERIFWKFICREILKNIFLERFFWNIFLEN